jgi:hypothetical protein
MQGFEVNSDGRLEIPTSYAKVVIDYISGSGTAPGAPPPDMGPFRPTSFIPITPNTLSDLYAYYGSASGGGKVGKSFPIGFDDATIDALNAAKSQMGTLTIDEINNILRQMGYAVPSAQTGGITTKEGLVNIHPNEAIIPLERLQNMLRGEDNTINQDINVGISGDIKGLPTDWEYDKNTGTFKMPKTDANVIFKAGGLEVPSEWNYDPNTGDVLIPSETMDIIFETMIKNDTPWKIDLASGEVIIPSASLEVTIEVDDSQVTDLYNTLQGFPTSMTDPLYQAQKEFLMTTPWEEVKRMMDTRKGTPPLEEQYGSKFWSKIEMVADYLGKTASDINEMIKQNPYLFEKALSDLGLLRKGDVPYWISSTGHYSKVPFEGFEPSLHYPEKMREWQETNPVIYIYGLEINGVNHVDEILEEINRRANVVK